MPAEFKLRAVVKNDDTSYNPADTPYHGQGGPYSSRDGEAFKIRCLQFKVKGPPAGDMGAAAQTIMPVGIIMLEAGDSPIGWAGKEVEIIVREIEAPAAPAAAS